MRLAAILLLLVTACGNTETFGPLSVDVIGEPGDPMGSSNSRSDQPSRLLLETTAQGLVARDGEGEIVPALAQRWTVLDDGSYIFRLGDHVWNDGTALTAGQIASRLRAAQRARHAIAPLLADIAEINAVTPDILEVRPARPRPDLLHLLAAPELAIFIDGEGLGPFALAEDDRSAEERIILVPRPRPIEADDEEETGEPDERLIAAAETVELRQLPPSMAAARFRLGRTALVIGGDWTTIAYAEAIEPAGALVVEPVIGLFGLGFVEENGFLGEAANRQILSLAVNREAIAAAFGRTEAVPRTTTLAADISGITQPVAPPWQSASLGARRRFARDAVTRWVEEHGPVAPLRIALPDTAGGRMLFRLLAAGWASIGIDVQAVASSEDADLRLIDEIAPTDRIEWFLQYFRCGSAYPCTEAYDEALARLAEAETPRVRAIRLVEAARALEGAAPFIPLMPPIRWSLVASSVNGFTPNRYASHPLTELTAGTN